MRPKHSASEMLVPLLGYSAPTASPSSPASYSPGIGSPKTLSTSACSLRRGPPDVLGPPGHSGIAKNGGLSSGTSDAAGRPNGSLPVAHAQLYSVSVEK